MSYNPQSNPDTKRIQPQGNNQSQSTPSQGNQPKSNQPQSGQSQGNQSQPNSGTKTQTGNVQGFPQQKTKAGDGPANNPDDSPQPQKNEPTKASNVA